jgi:hypothetical protein
MAKQKQPKEGGADEGAIVATAKTVGKLAGKVAATTGMSPERQLSPQPARAAAKTGKLPKKNKSRLPRRQKKAQRAAARKSDEPAQPSSRL